MNIYYGLVRSTTTLTPFPTPFTPFTPFIPFTPFTPYSPFIPYSPSATPFIPFATSFQLQLGLEEDLVL